MNNRFQFPYHSQRTAVMGSNMVSTSQPLASQAGLQMLQDGGNAVDAALAAAITLAVVEPTGNGLGSDAFALIWDGSFLHGINGSGRSPGTWSLEKFNGCESMPKYGWDSVTVPGCVSLWSTVSSRFGKLPFPALFKPAIRYADEGFPVSPIVARRWRETADEFRGNREFEKTFLPGGRAPLAGEIFRLQEAASTLEEIALTDGDSFYRGGLAKKMIACSKQQGGSMSFDDLASHTSEWVQPLSQKYRDCRLYELPPNGQGVAALIAVGILERFDLQRYPVDSADSIHLQVEAMKLAFSDVFTHIGDPAVMKINPIQLLDPGYLDQRAAAVDLHRVLFPKSGIQTEAGTVCLSAADSSGMMVSFIQSNFHGFGSGIVVPGTGISLNNRGYGFSLDTDHPNCVAGGKRPFHTIIPGFVLRDGKPVLSFGVMGAHMQAQGHVQMMTRIFDYGQNPQAASDAPRWHVGQDWQLSLEEGFGKGVVQELREKGHRILDSEGQHLFGGAQLIMNTGTTYIGGSDHRKDGQAVCF